VRYSDQPGVLTEVDELHVSYAKRFGDPQDLCGGANGPDARRRQILD